METEIVFCKVLMKLRKKIEGDKFEWRPDREDVHMNIETALRIGEPAKKLHTARSRNDQVATDFRLWCRDAIDSIIVKIKHLLTALVQLALKNKALIVLGYTHLQRAQPVLLPHVLLTYVEQPERDAGRYNDCRERLNLCPLGRNRFVPSPRISYIHLVPRRNRFVPVWLLERDASLVS